MKDRDTGQNWSIPRGKVVDGKPLHGHNPIDSISIAGGCGGSADGLVS